MTPDTCPVWDLTSYFPAFDGPEFQAHRDRLEQGLVELGESLKALGAITTDNVEAWESALARHEELLADYSHLASYIGCLVSADSNNDDYRREQARLSRLGATYKKAMAPYMAALRTVGDGEFDALFSRPSLASARYSFDRDREEAQKTMAPELEVLSADLGVDGIGAWGRLYNNVAGRLEFDLPQADGTTKKVPFAQKNTLLNDPDPSVRKAVLENSNAAWESVGDVAAACLNGIGGVRHTLNKYRGVDRFLDVAMFQSGVKQATIDQMWSVVTEHRALAQRYLRIKARLLGRGDTLGFQDLAAPLPIESSNERLTWQQGTEMLLGAFDADYPAFAEFARMMLGKKFVEAEPRAGKRPGAFCTSSYKSLESRVFMTFGGSVSDVLTLAHELGHAYHNWVMRDLRPFARSYPMTLAETASTFAEDLLARAVIDDPGTESAVRLQLLDMQLENAATFLLNIHMRYIFEEAFYTERANGELSVARLKELMLDAQRACYGDVLDADQMDPWFWASKLHFYITGITFYNFPYTFGYLFSQGLSARFQVEGAPFIPKYEQLLRLTGSDTAEGVAQRSLGVDLTQPDFWRDSLSVLENRIALFEKTAGELIK